MGFLRKLNPFIVTASSSGCDLFSNQTNTCDAWGRMLIIKLLFLISTIYTIVLSIVVGISEGDRRDTPIVEKYLIPIWITQGIMIGIYLFLVTFNWVSQYGNQNSVLSKLNGLNPQITCGSINPRCTSAPAGILSSPFFIAFGGILIWIGKDYSDNMPKDWQKSFGKATIIIGAVYLFFGIWILSMSLAYPRGNIFGGMLPVFRSKSLPVDSTP